MTSSEKRTFIWQVLRKAIYMTSSEKGNYMTRREQSNLYDKLWEK